MSYSDLKVQEPAKACPTCGIIIYGSVEDKTGTKQIYHPCGCHVPNNIEPVMYRPKALSEDYNA